VGSGTLPLSGTATGVIGTAPITATASGALDLAGTATGKVNVNGAANGDLPLGGTATATAPLGAVASGTLPLTGSGAGTAQFPGAIASGVLPLGGTATGVVVAGSLTAESIAQAVWGEVLEGGFTARELMQIIAAALAGKISGAGTPTVTIRDVSDTADRIVATVDANGNRLAVTTSV
jgi:hypothetical protein